jgi:hypothetical protein
VGRVAARAAAVSSPYSTLLQRLYDAVRTPDGCLRCSTTLRPANHDPACACPCHEAARVLRATGVIPKNGG